MIKFNHPPTYLPIYLSIHPSTCAAVLLHPAALCTALHCNLPMLIHLQPVAQPLLADQSIAAAASALCISCCRASSWRNGRLSFPAKYQALTASLSLLRIYYRRLRIDSIFRCVARFALLGAERKARQPTYNSRKSLLIRLAWRRSHTVCWLTITARSQSHNHELRVAGSRDEFQCTALHKAIIEFNYVLNQLPANELTTSVMISTTTTTTTVLAPGPNTLCDRS